MNGSEDKDEDYESFLLSPDTSLMPFCKTAHMPYDEVVTAILISVILNDKNADVSSDGKFADWEKGINLYEKAVKKLTKEDCDKLEKALN